MPTAMHPQAKFDPIPPDLDLHALVDQTPNFDWVVRISTAQIRRLGPSGFEKLVQLHVIEGGKPLVIEGWNKVLPDNLFSAQWLEKTYDKKQENVRDITAQSEIPMTTGHYLRSMRQLTNQWTMLNYRDERRQRLYLKDIDCPPEWFDHLKKVIPPNVFYMNENVSETPGESSRNDDVFGAPQPGVAVAGDLMSSLQEDLRAQNLMCYIGHEGTYTPAHKEMCASLGQNIMVEASEDGHGQKAGSSIWFMTETKDREVVREYFLSMLGHDIEIEKHFAQINAWKKANFPVYIVEQKVGDFILVPNLAPHQVWNRGTRTIKVAWNRTTVETLDLALHEALPKARLVCRDEQYKNKAIIYFTLEKYYKQLQSVDEQAEEEFLGLGQELSTSPRIKQMANDFRRLFELFTDILIDEMFGYKHVDIEHIPFDSNITCSYCRSNIFNRFLTCKCCVRQLVNGDEDTYDICLECYAMGRSCFCVSGLQWCEQWKWSDLVERHETWRAMVIKRDGFVDIDYSPQPLELARRKSGKKSVAQICQEQLRRRPWNDITKPAEKPVDEESEPEPEVDDEGRVKKKAKPKRKKKNGEVYRCHVCCHKDYTYKLQYCTTCPEAYCYGVLWRGFDTLPQAAMQQEHWQCPRCLGICNCGSCRRTGNTTPYVPKNTVLGHDTRRVADDRSVESIVDFRVHNLNWLKNGGEETRSKNTKRMQRLQEQADAEKAKDPLTGLQDAPHEIDPTMNGYNQKIGPDGLPAPCNGESPNAQGNVEMHDARSRVEMADMSGMQNGDDSEYPDLSAYPDHATGGPMMGMGFYDQDESADKILFDSFQLPSADAENNEPEVSEFVKKTLRLAKRKARLENDDDPDFQGPRSRWRKKPKTGNINQLVNLDPALLGALGEANGTGTSTRPNAREGSGDIATTIDTPQAEAGQPRLFGLPIDPLRPTLRHARPVQSYADMEEPDLDDPEDLLPAFPNSGKPSGRKTRPDHDNDDDDASVNEVSNDGKDPIALATDAIRALTQGDANREGDYLPNTTPSNPPMRRGRPGRPPKSARTSMAESVPPSTEPAKKRGRPPGARNKLRRSTTSNNDGENEDVDMPDVNDKEDDESFEDPEANPELETAHESRGKSLRREPNSQREGHVGGPTKRGRGRPPKQRSVPTQRPSPAQEPRSLTPIEVPIKPKLMSMAERMALKGKKIKIRERQVKVGTSDGNSNGVGKFSPAGMPLAKMEATPAEPAAVEDVDIGPSEMSTKRSRQEVQNEQDDDFEPPKEESLESTTTAPEQDEPEPEHEPERPAPVRKGPTIVRLDLSDEDSVSSQSVSDSDEDDDGIPSRPRYMAQRGGSTRGRGRGRGGSLLGRS